MNFNTILAHKAIHYDLPRQYTLEILRVLSGYRNVANLFALDKVLHEPSVPYRVEKTIVKNNVDQMSENF